VRLTALIKERIWPSQEPLPAGVWIHGVSLGEAELAATFGQILRQKLPDVSVTLTASTPAGVGLLRKKFPSGTDHPPVRAFPLDLPFSVRRAFDSLSPKLLVLMETELWPTALREAGSRRVPVLIVNAKLSERSLSRLKKARFFFDAAFKAISHIAARTPQDAARFQQLGFSESSITVCGDLKYDRTLPESSPIAVALKELARDRPILVGGSLAPEEIPLVLDLFETLKKRPRTDRILLLLAPRRPDSFETAENELTRRGLAHLRRSQWPGEVPALPPDVVLLDTIGELAGAYSAATVAILGGTFAPKGGHNILEPLYYGLPVVLGPSITSIRQTVADAEGAVFSVASAEDASGAVERLLLDSSARTQAREKARLLFDRNRGAGNRAAAIALSLLETFR
jgi:3-deoxy-D-manno-octulosonic-acid transferase